SASIRLNGISSISRAHSTCATYSSQHSTPPKSYTLSLHDALPIYNVHAVPYSRATSLGTYETLGCFRRAGRVRRRNGDAVRRCRSEEHTSELQSRGHLVCRLLLEKKKLYDSVAFSQAECYYNLKAS